MAMTWRADAMLAHRRRTDLPHQMIILPRPCLHGGSPDHWQIAPRLWLSGGRCLPSALTSPEGIRSPRSRAARSDPVPRVSRCLPGPSPELLPASPCGASRAASVSAGTWLACCPASAEVPCRFGEYPVAVPISKASRPGSTAQNAAAPASPARAGGRSAIARRVRASRCLSPAQMLRPVAVMTMRWRRRGALRSGRAAGRVQPASPRGPARPAGRAGLCPAPA